MKFSSAVGQAGVLPSGLGGSDLREETDLKPASSLVRVAHHSPAHLSEKKPLAGCPLASAYRARPGCRPKNGLRKRGASARLTSMQFFGVA